MGIVLCPKHGIPSEAGPFDPLTQTHHIRMGENIGEKLTFGLRQTHATTSSDEAIPILYA
ncbi:hypothetical protein GCM10007160_07110 [Litchfieldella qijiaojingensis]|uniref:Uncharacterized protein n=1 Tax=Litchfieldella qijiaojingensis TaxID=980347 RepID=A0ABQ2YFH3_9GAMM|nr:hypothetical protein GCM10007160_07110 [Halomonas qijiaojingensis]